MQRAYDQVIHDVAIQQLPVVFCLDRAGLVGEDGPRITGPMILPTCAGIPHMIVSAPMNESELRNLMYTAQLETTAGPFVIRYHGRRRHAGMEKTHYRNHRWQG